ncbi:MAG TPA: hypothetical protein PKB03_01775 [Baekduia sp.]|nr:hypothetical protein [Baekduia sp.]
MPDQHPIASGRDRLISWFDYHDLAQRLSVWATDGGRWLRGDRHDLRVAAHGDFELAPDERELQRIAAVVLLVGPFQSRGESEASLGAVMEAAATLIVTSERLIVVAVGGATALGTIRSEREIHTFVLPWDLVDLIQTGDLAGDRTVDLYCAHVQISLILMPHFKEGTGSRYRDRDPLDAGEAFSLLSSAAATHRLAVCPPSERARLEALKAGCAEIEHGERTAAITRDHPRRIVPPHLRGRLVGHDGEPLADPMRHRAAAALLLLET